MEQIHNGPIAHPHKYNCTYSIHPTNAHDSQLMSRFSRLVRQIREAAGWTIAPEHGLEPAIHRGLNELDRGIMSAYHILRLVQ
jgi:hypothetical protein